MTMTEPMRTDVTLHIRTAKRAYLSRQDLTEFLAACHRHDVPDDARIECDYTTNDGGSYFALVAIRSLETGSR